MKDKEILDMLKTIKRYLKNDKIQEAIDYIDRKKKEVNNKVDYVSNYMDKLVKDLK